jgi:hypothetical protein
VPTHPAIWKLVDTIVTPCGLVSRSRWDSANVCAGPMMKAVASTAGTYRAPNSTIESKPAATPTSVTKTAIVR